MEGCVKRQRVLGDTIPRDIWTCIARHCDWPELVALSRVNKKIRDATAKQLEDAMFRLECLLSTFITRHTQFQGYCYRLVPDLYHAWNHGWRLYIDLEKPWRCYSVWHRLDIILRNMNVIQPVRIENVRIGFGEDFANFFRIQGWTGQNF